MDCTGIADTAAANVEPKGSVDDVRRSALSGYGK
jgi:hypothetical protein